MDPRDRAYVPTTLGAARAPVPTDGPRRARRGAATGPSRTPPRVAGPTATVWRHGRRTCPALSAGRRVSAIVALVCAGRRLRFVGDHGGHAPSTAPLDDGRRLAGAAPAAADHLDGLPDARRRPVRDRPGPPRLPAPRGRDPGRSPCPASRPPSGTATDGTLLVNPGGPGESGNQILPARYPLLPAAVRAARTSSASTPGAPGRATPSSAAPSLAGGHQRAAGPGPAGQPLPGTAGLRRDPRACAAAAPGPDARVDTVDTARDMDRIRQALGLPTISFYGLSYGTVLGTAYAVPLPPPAAGDGPRRRRRHLRPAGRPGRRAGPGGRTLARAPAGHLWVGPDCPLGPTPWRSTTGLQASIAAHPLPAPGQRRRHPGHRRRPRHGHPVRAQRPRVHPALRVGPRGRSHGDGSGLRTLALEFVVDIDGAPLVDAQWAITCNDTAGHPGPVAAGALARMLAARYPLLGGYAVNYNLGGCVAWPDGRHRWPHSTRSTPHRSWSSATRATRTPRWSAPATWPPPIPTPSQLTWVGWGHTWLLSGSSDTCVQAAVSRYLAGGGLPPPGTVCH